MRMDLAKKCVFVFIISFVVLCADEIIKLVDLQGVDWMSCQKEMSSVEGECEKRLLYGHNPQGFPHKWVAKMDFNANIHPIPQLMEHTHTHIYIHTYICLYVMKHFGSQVLQGSKYNCRGGNFLAN
jgi:hypothetical protein